MIFTKRQLRLVVRLLFLLVPYSLLRIGFYFYHLDIYKQFTQEEIFESFLLGIRFDIAAICLLNAPLILLSCFPRVNEKLGRLLFVVLNTAGIMASLDDYELFLFMGKRLSFDFFVITEDIIQQLPQVMLYYWYLPLIAVLMGVGLYFFDKKFFSVKPGKEKVWRTLPSGLFLAGLAFVGIRGGLQHKSINVQSAFVQGKNELGHLVLNTPYHFLRTLKNRSVERLGHFKRDDEAKNVILNHRSLRRTFEPKSGSNIVLIILESFALEYMENGHTPFLNELKEKSLFFSRHLANGRRSIEVLPSVLCGLPSLIDEPISKSMFAGNKFACLPKILKKEGYTNHFYHAGSRGTMGFEAYTLANGFDRYFSKEDYPGGDYDGTWGIFDGPYLKYFGEQLGQMPQPFMAAVFTLSSHHPYTIPKALEGKFNKGTLEIHESIQYTDWALRNFFEQIKIEPWFDNTLFVITADHTSKLETRKFKNLVGHYRVPLLLYSSGQQWKGIKTSKTTQHSDIPDTVLEYLGVSGDELPAIGRSVLSGEQGIAINYADGRTYFMVQGNEVLTLDKNNQQQEHFYDWATGEMRVKGPTQNRTLRAYMQYFINGLINNNLSLYR